MFFFPVFVLILPSPALANDSSMGPGGLYHQLKESRCSAPLQKLVETLLPPEKITASPPVIHGAYVDPGLTGDFYFVTIDAEALRRSLKKAMEGS